jgi:hypothetical protein
MTNNPFTNLWKGKSQLISKGNLVSRVRLTCFQKYSYIENNFHKDLDDFKFILMNFFVNYSFK